METEDLFYPELTEAAQKEAQILIEKFKEKLKFAADETISEFYCNMMPFIESDSWTNFRNSIMDGFRNYNNRKIEGEYDFKKIRQQILKEHRDDLVKDLDKDMIEEIKQLKETIERIQELRHNHL